MSLSSQLNEIYIARSVFLCHYIQNWSLMFSYTVCMYDIIIFITQTFKSYDELKFKLIELSTVRCLA